MEIYFFPSTLSRSGVVRPAARRRENDHGGAADLHSRRARHGRAFSKKCNRNIINSYVGCQVGNSTPGWKSTSCFVREGPVPSCFPLKIEFSHDMGRIIGDSRQGSMPLWGETDDCCTHFLDAPKGRPGNAAGNFPANTRGRWGKFTRELHPSIRLGNGCFEQWDIKALEYGKKHRGSRRVEGSLHVFHSWLGRAPIRVVNRIRRRKPGRGVRDRETSESRREIRFNGTDEKASRHIGRNALDTPVLEYAIAPRRCILTTRFTRSDWGSDPRTRRLLRLWRCPFFNTPRILNSFIQRRHQPSM